MPREGKSRRSNNKLHCTINLAAVPKSQMEAVFQKKKDQYTVLYCYTRRKNKCCLELLFMLNCLSLLSSLV